MWWLVISFSIVDNENLFKLTLQFPYNVRTMIYNDQCWHTNKRHTTTTTTTTNNNNNNNLFSNS